jgi:toxin ParE1/3/4
VDAAFARAIEAPQSFPIVYRTLRRIVLRRFPYLVYFRLEEDVVQVFGVPHGRAIARFCAGVP